MTTPNEYQDRFWLKHPTVAAGVPVDPPTSRWTVVANCVYCTDDYGEIICNVGSHGETPDALAMRVAAALNAGHPDPADTEPTADAVQDALIAGDRVPDELVPAECVIQAVLDARAALMREGDDSRG